MWKIQTPPPTLVKVVYIWNVDFFDFGFYGLFPQFVTFSFWNAPLRLLQKMSLNFNQTYKCVSCGKDIYSILWMFKSLPLCLIRIFAILAPSWGWSVLSVSQQLISALSASVPGPSLASLKHTMDTDFLTTVTSHLLVTTGLPRNWFSCWMGWSSLVMGTGMMSLGS